jgi:hypothetical protein
MLNDFQVDSAGEYIYIADTSIVAGTPAIIVYSIAEQKAYRLLSGAESLYGKSYFVPVGGTILRLGPVGLRINVDGIALSRDGKNLIFAAVTGDRLYRLSIQHIMEFIRDEQAAESTEEMSLLSKRLIGSVNVIAEHRPICDGMSMDLDGRLWLTAFSQSAIVITEPLFGAKSFDNVTSRFLTLVQSSRMLRWPDGFSFGPDGVYVTNSALHLKFSGDLSSAAPFHILKVPLAALKGLFGEEYVLPPSGQ